MEKERLISLWKIYKKRGNHDETEMVVQHFRRLFAALRRILRE